MMNQSRQSLLGTLLLINDRFADKNVLILTLEGAAIAHMGDSHTLAGVLSICKRETVVDHTLQEL